MFVQILLFFFPWRIRKYLLKKLCHFELSDNTKIGFSIILAKKVILRDNARIGHFNFVKPIDCLQLNENSKIGSRNWITGFSVKDVNVIKKSHFSHVKDRQCVLILGKESSVTSRHYFDCNGGIYIGNYCTIAGFETAFLTHSIDLKNNRQDALPIVIGDYTFIGARCTILKGTKLPDYSVLGACSLLNKQYENNYGLYAGTPARYIKSLEGYQYFSRKQGFVK